MDHLLYYQFLAFFRAKKYGNLVEKISVRRDRHVEEIT